MEHVVWYVLLITVILSNTILFHFHDLLWIHICVSVCKIEKQKQFTSITRKSGQYLAALSLEIKFAASFKIIFQKNKFLFFFHDTGNSSNSYYVIFYNTSDIWKKFIPSSSSSSLDNIFVIENFRCLDIRNQQLIGLLILSLNFARLNIKLYNM